jgi:hypothetical protein
MILTNRELIVIHEEGRQREKNSYGGIWDFIPLNKIKSMSLIEKNNNVMALSIQLPRDSCLEFLFQASAKHRVEQLMDRFRELKVVTPPSVR